MKAEGSFWGNLGACWVEIGCGEASLRRSWAISNASSVEIEGKEENLKDLKAISMLVRPK